MARKQWNSFIFGNFLAFSTLLIINAFWDIGSLIYLPLGVVITISFVGMLRTAKEKDKKGSEK